MPKPEIHFNFSILSEDPFITLSSINLGSVPLEKLFIENPEVFRGRRSLHIVAPTWNLEITDLKPMAESVQKISKSFPRHQFLFLANTEFEAFRLSGHGLRSILFPHSVFQDEKVFRPVKKSIKGLPKADALMIAHLGEFKHHDLCTKLNSPLFVYGINPLKELESDFKRVQKLCPDAVYVNHHLNEGKHELLDGPTLARVASHAKVGLCLSEVEGHMRASIQMLMCGLPIVTLKCIGGRERYYDDSIALEVSPTPEAVRDGVEEMVGRKLSRARVRAKVLEKVEMDRVNCLRSLNKILKLYFPKKAPSFDFETFRGFKFRNVSGQVALDMLKASREKA